MQLLSLCLFQRTGSSLRPTGACTYPTSRRRMPCPPIAASPNTSTVERRGRATEPGCPSQVCPEGAQRDLGCGPQKGGLHRPLPVVGKGSWGRPPLCRASMQRRSSCPHFLCILTPPQCPPDHGGHAEHQVTLLCLAVLCAHGAQVAHKQWTWGPWLLGLLLRAVSVTG